MFLPMSCRSPCTVPISTLASFFGSLAGRLLDQRLGDGADIFEHFAGQHEFGQEILALLEALADDVHGVAAQLQHPQRIGAFFEQHLLGEREGVVLVHVGEPLDKLPFLIGHFSHRNPPGSYIRVNPRVCLRRGEFPIRRWLPPVCRRCGNP